jgi:hypothetical protein
MKTYARLAFVEKLARLINDSPMTQVALADSLDYDNPNIITMIKQGRTRLPLGKVAPLARALGETPQSMLRDWLQAYEPEALLEIEAMCPPGVTSEEMSWVRELRDAFGKVPRFEVFTGEREAEH